MVKIYTEKEHINLFLKDKDYILKILNDYFLALNLDSRKSKFSKDIFLEILVRITAESFNTLDTAFGNINDYNDILEELSSKFSCCGKDLAYFLNDIEFLANENDFVLTTDDNFTITT